MTVRLRPYAEAKVFRPACVPLRDGGSRWRPPSSAAAFSSSSSPSRAALALPPALRRARIECGGGVVLATFQSRRRSLAEGLGEALDELAPIVPNPSLAFVFTSRHGMGPQGALVSSEWPSSLPTIGCTVGRMSGGSLPGTRPWVQVTLVSLPPHVTVETFATDHGGLPALRDYGGLLREDDTVFLALVQPAFLDATGWPALASRVTSLLPRAEIAGGIAHPDPHGAAGRLFLSGPSSFSGGTSGSQPPHRSVLPSSGSLESAPRVGMTTRAVGVALRGFLPPASSASTAALGAPGVSQASVPARAATDSGVFATLVRHVFGNTPTGFLAEGPVLRSLFATPNVEPGFVPTRAERAYVNQGTPIPASVRAALHHASSSSSSSSSPPSSSSSPPSSLSPQPPSETPLLPITLPSSAARAWFERSQRQMHVLDALRHRVGAGATMCGWSHNAWAAEDILAQSASASAFPVDVFMLDVGLVPGQRAVVQLFESRYRLLFRRHMEEGRLVAFANVPRVDSFTPATVLTARRLLQHHPTDAMFRELEATSTRAASEASVDEVSDSELDGSLGGRDAFEVGESSDEADLLRHERGPLGSLRRELAEPSTAHIAFADRSTSSAAPGEDGPRVRLGTATATHSTILRDFPGYGRVNASNMSVHEASEASEASSAFADDEGNSTGGETDTETVARQAIAVRRNAASSAVPRAFNIVPVDSTRDQRSSTGKAGLGAESSEPEDDALPTQPRPSSRASSASSSVAGFATDLCQTGTVMAIRQILELDAADGRVVLEIEGVRRVRFESARIADAAFGLIEARGVWLDDAEEVATEDGRRQRGYEVPNPSAATSSSSPSSSLKQKKKKEGRSETASSVPMTRPVAAVMHKILTLVSEPYARRVLEDAGRPLPSEKGRSGGQGAMSDANAAPNATATKTASLASASAQGGVPADASKEEGGESRSVAMDAGEAGVLTRLLDPARVAPSAAPQLPYKLRSTQVNWTAKMAPRAATTALRQWLQRVAIVGGVPPEPTTEVLGDPTRLSWWLAGALPVPPSLRQRYLDLTSTEARLKLEWEILRSRQADLEADERAEPVDWNALIASNGEDSDENGDEFFASLPLDISERRDPSERIVPFDEDDRLLTAVPDAAASEEPEGSVPVGAERSSTPLSSPLDASRSAAHARSSTTPHNVSEPPALPSSSSSSSSSSASSSMGQATPTRSPPIRVLPFHPLTSTPVWRAPDVGAALVESGFGLRSLFPGDAAVTGSAENLLSSHAQASLIQILAAAEEEDGDGDEDDGDGEVEGVGDEDEDSDADEDEDSDADDFQTHRGSDEDDDEDDDDDDDHSRRRRRDRDEEEGGEDEDEDEDDREGEGRSVFRDESGRASRATSSVLNWQAATLRSESSQRPPVIWRAVDPSSGALASKRVEAEDLADLRRIVAELEAAAERDEVEGGGGHGVGKDPSMGTLRGRGSGSGLEVPEESDWEEDRVSVTAAAGVARGSDRDRWSTAESGSSSSSSSSPWANKRLPLAAARQAGHRPLRVPSALAGAAESASEDSGDADAREAEQLVVAATQSRDASTTRGKAAPVTGTGVERSGGNETEADGALEISESDEEWAQWWGGSSPNVLFAEDLEVAPALVARQLTKSLDERLLRRPVPRGGSGMSEASSNAERPRATRSRGKAGERPTMFDHEEGRGHKGTSSAAATTTTTATKSKSKNKTEGSQATKQKVNKEMRSVSESTGTPPTSSSSSSSSSSSATSSAASGSLGSEKRARASGREPRAPRSEGPGGRGSGATGSAPEAER